MLKPTATLLLALLAAGCSSPDSHDDEPLPAFGVHVAETETDDAYGERLQLAQSLSLDLVRIPVDWARLEPEPGRFDEGYLQSIRSRMSQLAALNMKAIMLFAQSPPWANGGQAPAYPPTAAHYASYANALVRLIRSLEDHRDRIRAWEIWNEPNSIEFWPSWPQPRAGSHVLVLLDAAREYARLLQTTRDAIVHNDLDTPLLGGSLASADTDYLSMLFQTWGSEVPMTGLALHPYTRVDERPGSHHGLAQYPNQCNPEDDLSPPWCFEQGLENIRILLNDEGLGALPIWITEFGVASGDGWGEAGSEEAQARHLSLALEILKQHSGKQDLNVAAALWYRLMDEDAHLPEGDRFGLYREDGSMKPAAGILRER